MQGELGGGLTGFEHGEILQTSDRVVVGRFETILFYAGRIGSGSTRGSDSSIVSFGNLEPPDCLWNRNEHETRNDGRAAILGTVETFDHTADVGLRVTGADLDDLFRTAAGGLFDYIVANRDAVRTDHRESVELRGDDPADLLAAWLSELIFLCETRHTLYNAFDVRVAADGQSLHAEIAGEPIDPVRHELDHEVKAVTRHGLDLRPQPGGWVAEVILDI